MNIDYKIKYLKYKQKYLLLTSQHGGKKKFKVKRNNPLILYNNYLFHKNDKKIGEKKFNNLQAEKIDNFDNLYIELESKKILGKYNEKVFQCEYFKIYNPELYKYIYLCKLKLNVDPKNIIQEKNIFNIFLLPYNQKTQNYAWKCYDHFNKKKSIALMVAGNSGRPGGNSFNYGFVSPDHIHSYHTTQEESVISNFVCNTVVKSNNILKQCKFKCGRLANPGTYKKNGKINYYKTCCQKCGINPTKHQHNLYCNDKLKIDFNKEKQYFFFKDKTTPLWGLEQGNTNNYTVDNYNYLESKYKDENGQIMNDEKGNIIYNKPDHLSDIVELSTEYKYKQIKNYDFSKKFSCKLIFVAGPNMSKGKTPSGSMAKTFSEKALTNYEYFREGVKTALKSGLIKCAVNNIDIIFIASVSLGIYSNDNPNFKNKLKEEFVNILEDILTSILKDYNYKFDYIFFVTDNFDDFNIKINYKTNLFIN